MTLRGASVVDVLDPLTFPSLHGRPTAGWVNDPNGLVHHDGRWHVFFQHNPDGPHHDAICWGHASSPDLLTWEQHPVALRPRPDGPDAHGCWSGCAVLDRGLPVLLYSAVRDTSGRSEVVLARPQDPELTSWRPDPDPRPVVGMPTAADGLAGIDDVRDPFVWHLDGHRFAVQGAGGPHGPARVLVYDAEDLAAWRLLGELLGPSDPRAAQIAPADIWECPSLVPYADGWLLVVSLWRQGEAPEPTLAGVRWLTGDVERDQAGVPRFAVRDGGLLDTGPAFYAPQLLLDHDRILLWGWSWEGHDDTATWAGSLTWPREVVPCGDRPGLRPAAELVGLRGDPVRPAVDGTLSEVAFEAHLEGPGGLWLERAGGGSEPVLAWTDPGPAQVLVDASMVEGFGATGVAHTVRAYRRPGDRWRLEGRVTEAWRLREP